MCGGEAPVTKARISIPESVANKPSVLTGIFGDTPGSSPPACCLDRRRYFWRQFDLIVRCLLEQSFQCLHLLSLNPIEVILPIERPPGHPAARCGDGLLGDRLGGPLRGALRPTLP